MLRPLLLLPLVLLAGCLERRIHITSEPPGATVWVNDVEVGRTPCSADFTFYGTYDVRLRLEGYEPLSTRAVAKQPIYEYPPIDLAATILPARITTDIRWHFTLEPSLESTQAKEEFERQLVDRARRLQAIVDAPE